MDPRSRWAGALLFLIAETALGAGLSFAPALPPSPTPASQPFNAKAKPQTCGQLIDALERSVVDLQARDWSSLMALPGFAPDEVSASPESSIVTPGLRQSFKSRLAYWNGRSAPPLDEKELARIKKVEAKVAALAGSCK